MGVVTRRDLQHVVQEDQPQDGNIKIGTLIKPDPVVAYPDEPLRSVVFRMAETGYTRFPVVNRDRPRELVGIVSLSDLLKARMRNLEEERKRERVLRLNLLFPLRGAGAPGAGAIGKQEIVKEQPEVEEEEKEAQLP